MSFIESLIIENNCFYYQIKMICIKHTQIFFVFINSNNYQTMILIQILLIY